VLVDEDDLDGVAWVKRSNGSMAVGKGGTPNFRFVPLRMDHAELLFAWQNDAFSLAMSRTTAKAEWSDHLKWVEDAINSDVRRVNMAELDGQLIGWARFDLGDETELSWYVDPNFRGAGNGRLIVSESLKTYNGSVLAVIKPENVGSIRIAQRSGFLCCKYEDGFLYFKRK
jgi:RimJ/RimL family protein N-acetyltransferase